MRRARPRCVLWSRLMLLFFRLAAIIIRNFFRRRMTIGGQSVLHFRVWPTDMDLNFHLNDGRYISLTGLGRVDLMMRTGLLRRALKRGWYPVVGAATIRYRREIRSFEAFAMHSRIAGWDEKWFYFEHQFEKHGTLAALAYARGVMRTRAGAVPSADVLALAGWSEPSPKLPEAIERWRGADVP